MGIANDGQWMADDKLFYNKFLWIHVKYFPILNGFKFLQNLNLEWKIVSKIGHETGPNPFF